MNYLELVFQFDFEMKMISILMFIISNHKSKGFEWYSSLTDQTITAHLGYHIFVKNGTKKMNQLNSQPIFTLYGLQK